MKHKSLKLSFSAKREEGLKITLPCGLWDWTEAFTPLPFATHYLSDAAYRLSGAPATIKCKLYVKVIVPLPQVTVGERLVLLKTQVVLYHVDPSTPSKS